MGRGFGAYLIVTLPPVVVVSQSLDPSSSEWSRKVNSRLRYRLGAGDGLGLPAPEVGVVLVLARRVCDLSLIRPPSQRLLRCCEAETSERQGPEARYQLREKHCARGNRYSRPDDTKPANERRGGLTGKRVWEQQARLARVGRTDV